MCDWKKLKFLGEWMSECREGLEKNGEVNCGIVIVIGIGIGRIGEQNLREVP